MVVTYRLVQSLDSTACGMIGQDTVRAKCTPPAGTDGAEKETLCSQRASSWEAEALGRNPSYGEAQGPRGCSLNSRETTLTITLLSLVYYHVIPLLSQGPNTRVVRLVFSKKHTC